ncbi:hypothetical protein ACFQZO_09990 [Bradyrhizobium sp. GCM10027634]|uniref:hypothetical protein n=1 Tax=unclassified Bradyrhizobium TaxID=2631580 RepID=UPI00263A7645|nr:hypothetical protein [Bradyrhizobium sp. WYCCWR 12677]MDN5001212.1 hypothetical protein [Bradyrhizobium sp. WYCCWR 12677]
MPVVALACFSAADARQAHRAPISGRGAGYEGYWNVLIITDAGTCDRTYSFPVQIAGGRVLSGGMAEVAGSVGRSGVVTVQVSSGGSYANGSGRLGGAFGSGRWSGRGSAGFCSGRWRASRG